MILTVTNIESVNKKRFKIDINGSFAFALYGAEVKRFHIEQNQDMQEETMNEIHKLLVKRARERALYLVEHQERTRMDLTRKLRQSYYTDDVIEEVISFLEEYQYLDDTRYAKHFALDRKDKKSRKEIAYALRGKGVAKELIEETIKELPEEGEQLQRLVDIRMKRYQNPTREDIYKVYQYFLRRGFSSSDIRYSLSKYK